MDAGHMAGVAMVISQIMFSCYGSNLEYSKNFRSMKIFRPMVSCTLLQL